MAPLSSRVTSQPRSPRYNVQLSLTRVNLAFFGQAVEELYGRKDADAARPKASHGISNPFLQKYGSLAAILKAGRFPDKPRKRRAQIGHARIKLPGEGTGGA